MFLSEKEKLDKFLYLRNYYIDLLESKAINKLEFNHKNNEIFEKINLRPFTVLDSFEKALFNYNYYNSKAKLAHEDYKFYMESGNKRKAKIANNNKINFYTMKDIAIESMLLLEQFLDIEAYYIHMHSKNLSTEIYEILFYKKERVILHTKNPKIKKLLHTNNCFSEDIKDSLIASYINN